MARIKSKGTRPEMVVRKGLFARGFRFRLHNKDLPGKPDLVLPKYRAVIFVHGCFWHAHGCKRFRMPNSNTNYWTHKFELNKANDQKKTQELTRRGWRVLEIWECSIKNTHGIEKVLNATAVWLRGGPL